MVGSWRSWRRNFFATKWPGLLRNLILKAAFGEAMRNERCPGRSVAPKPRSSLVRSTWKPSENNSRNLMRSLPLSLVRYSNESVQNFSCEMWTLPLLKHTADVPGAQEAPRLSVVGVGVAGAAGS